MISSKNQRAEKLQQKSPTNSPDLSLMLAFSGGAIKPSPPDQHIATAKQQNMQHHTYEKQN
jgi:hypothetical protein